MAGGNVELTRKVIESMNRRDLDGFLELMDEDVEVHSRIIAIEGGLRGHGGVRRWWKEWFTVFPDYAIEVGEIWEDEDITLAPVQAEGHGAGSHVPVLDTIWVAGRWRGGRVVWWRVCGSRDEACESAGLAPPPS